MNKIVFKVTQNGVISQIIHEYLLAIDSNSYDNRGEVVGLPTIVVGSSKAIAENSWRTGLSGVRSYDVLSNGAAGYGHCSTHLRTKMQTMGAWRLRATYDDHLRLIGKRVVEFLLALIELFRQMLQLRLYERLLVENR